jgi:hypothetical protein
MSEAELDVVDPTATGYAAGDVVGTLPACYEVELLDAIVEGVGEPVVESRRVRRHVRAQGHAEAAQPRLPAATASPGQERSGDPVDMSLLERYGVDVGDDTAPSAGQDGGAAGLFGWEEREDVAEQVVLEVAEAVASGPPLGGQRIHGGVLTRWLV